MRFLVALCLVLLIMSVTISRVFATPRHGCAPLTPPAVPGSLAQPPAIQGLLSINEVLLTSRSLWGCPEAGTPPPSTDMWVEIYNPQDQPFDLFSVHTSLDSGPNSNPFYFPFGAAIGAHAFLVVFPHISPLFSSTQTPTLRLIIAGIVIDQIIVPSLGEDQSYARVPDGSNSWQITSQPTIDTSNNPPPNVSTPTPRPHKTTKQPTSTSTKGQTSKGTVDNASDGTNQPAVVNGTQPTWTALRLPSPTATPPMQVIPTESPPVAPQSSGPGDVPQKILLTTGAIILPLLLLFWSRRFFTRRKEETSK